MIRVGVDVGGTFTDLVALDGTRVTTGKVPSTPDDQSEGVMRALDAIEAGDVTAFAHGMTVATNALLERRGARTALITTEGFRDLIELARQDRPSLYDLAERRPEPLVPRDLRFTVQERMGPEGELEPLDEDSVKEAVDALREAEVDAVAVCLLFAFLHPEHEQRVGEAVREALPDLHISLSSEVLPEFREYERFSTTVADAYLGPKLAAYLERLAGGADEAGVPAPLVMQSSGGVVDVGVAATAAAGCVLSGPAGGVVGAAHVAKASGYEDVLTFDMGGTSTDVAPVLGGEASTTTESVVAGVPIKLPMVDVHTVSAGGGSIAWADPGGALRVGPRSAGADPGPAAYGKGGEEPTVTDANLLLGYLGDGAELGGELTLSAEARRGRIADARQGARPRRARDRARRRARGQRRDGPGAAGDLGRARARPARVRARGLRRRRRAARLRAGRGARDPGRARAARRRRAERPRAGDVATSAATTCARCWAATDAEDAFAAMEEQAREDMDEPELRRRADLRYRGQSFELTVEADDLDAVEERFAEEHERRYGYRMEGEDVELVNARVVATVPVERPELVAEEAEGDAEAGERRGQLRRRLERGAGLPPRRDGRGLRGRGPGDRRVRRGDLRRAARAGRARSTSTGTLVLERDEPRSRHPVACSPARFRASPRRPARC